MTTIKNKLIAAAAAGALTSIAMLGSGAAPAVAAARNASSSSSVSVVYAGSLANLNDNVLGPAFQKATGITYEGQGGGSDAMAQELASHTISGDVFESVGLDPIETLEPSQTTWAVRIAAQPLVIAYNPDSQYASYFNQVASGKVKLKAFFQFLASHNLNIGRTDPETDPQGAAFYEMVELAARYYHLPGGTVQNILGAWNNPRQIYSEEGLPTELQSGGLDLSSAYLPQAVQAHMSYIKLPGYLNFSDAADAGWYAKATIKTASGTLTGGVLAIWATVLNKSATGTQFLSYLIKNESLLKPYKYSVLTPVVKGTVKNVPSTIPHV